jgi:radical SAM superfamily enzyme YgiQ (UPF0313 family)
MKEIGLSYISLGIESANDTILKRFNKGITKKINERAISIINETNISMKQIYQ